MDYLLRVEYNTTVNKLYSMVADHYKISAECVVLKMSDCNIVCGDTELHVLFYTVQVFGTISVVFYLPEWV